MSVRGVVDARAAMISRVVDDDWLEVMTVVGEPSAGIVPGLRWRRADLDLLLAHAEELGRLRFTKGRSISYAEVPTSTPETERYIVDHLGLLLAPLLTASGDLLGVLSTEGPVDTAHPAPGACERVELYAEQGRLALSALRDQGLLTERLRLSDAAHDVLTAAAAAEDLPAFLDIVAEGLGAMLPVRGAWACAELERGLHAEAASYPPAVSERLGADVCTLLQPMTAICLLDETTLTDRDAPLLGRLAAVAGQHQALLATVGDGTGSRGSILLLRDAGDDAWTPDERRSVFDLGRRLGTLADQVRGRRRDQETAAGLLRLDEYRRDLVASITHDLKTPLTAIALNTELLESDVRLAEAGSHPVAAIRRSADRLADLLDDLLAMSRVEEGISPLIETDLVELLREACAHAETETVLREVVFELDTPEELWVTADVTALARIFVNLVDNAVKFSLPRGRVVLHLARTGDGFEFRCTDEGIGIQPDRLDAIFDISRRTPDSRTEVLPGSGIGLMICERIITRLGGGISVESTPGQGSTFTVRIPC